MKKNEMHNTAFTNVQLSSGVSKPVTPREGQTTSTGRHCPDPSSVIRSSRYPLPTYFEMRMRSSD